MQIVICVCLAKRKTYAFDGGKIYSNKFTYSTLQYTHSHIHTYTDIHRITRKLNVPYKTIDKSILALFPLYSHTYEYITIWKKKTPAVAKNIRVYGL